MPSEALPNDAPLFAIEQARFTANGRTLLGPLSLAVPSGAFIGLIGHNGSGKSTLLKMLARQQPGQGVIQLRGRPLAQWGEREFAREVGYLPQATPTGSGLLVKELVALGRYPWHGALGRFSAADRAKVEQALALTGLDPLAGRVVDTLSGGERQRAWIAMLVAQDTKCLLLDEPISALDIAHQIEILAMIKDLAHRRGIGVVAVLHDVNMAARFCDHIIALQGGKLIAQGPPAEIMQPGPLEAIYGIAMGVIAAPEAGLSFCYAR
ncbi:ATP-binding cassette domain-containing protein [Ancylobacter sp. FA202]|uniref:ATP-binding cassette domain-containing protein n=1 Tax=Ancylobacter sp. FA202 TaxID=1111106 RepID=UPI00037B18A5|nr:ATP-binding cassette domain-containing protein [Ancylobacter sp. FA202]